MQNTRTLLVVIDPKHNDSPALKRAKQIADKTKAHIHLLICDKDNDHLALLSLLQKGLVESGYSVSTECAWHGSEHETIINIQQALNCGLVIKQHLPENPIKALLLTPEDWKLLRACPCPVLIAKHSRPWEGGVVLAAVDVGNTEPEHRQLHESIVDSGFNIASLIKGELHVVSAFPPPMLATVDAITSASQAGCDTPPPSIPQPRAPRCIRTWIMSTPGRAPPDDSATSSSSIRAHSSPKAHSRARLIDISRLALIC